MCLRIRFAILRIRRLIAFVDDTQILGCLAFDIRVDAFAIDFSASAALAWARLIPLFLAPHAIFFHVLSRLSYRKLGK